MTNEADPSGRQEPDRFRALVEAMGDPRRSRILSAVAERPRGVTIRELAQRLDEPERQVRYHLDLLYEQGLLAVAEEIQRRGVIERLYCAQMPPVISQAESKALEDGQSRRVSAQILRSIVADAAAAASAGLLGKPAGHLMARIPREVDRKGWEELAAVYEDSLRQIQEVLARAGRRLEADDEAPIRAVTALVMFEAPPWRA
jgi:DNA-binding transcriptional ArsR family regulator